MKCPQKALLAVLLLVSFFCASTLAACSRCDKGWFLPNQKYVYKYEAIADSGFVGTSKERSGLKLSCNVNVITPCQCKDGTKVTVNKCEMQERTAQGYQPADQSFAKSLEKHLVEFVLEDGLIKGGKMTAHKQDSGYVLNMKRGIIQMLQLKMQSPEKYDQVVNQEEIFGMCPMQYTFSKTKPWTIRTRVDITHCDLPSIFEFQFTMKSLIKTVLGGRQVKNISEMIYPFDSFYTCDYKVSDQRQIDSVSCLQNQAFRVLKQYGNIEATAMYNISQSLIYKDNGNATPKDKKKIPKSKVNNAGLKFIFVHDHRKEFAEIKAGKVYKLLEELVIAYLTQPIDNIPSLFDGFVDRIRQATPAVLEEAFDMIKVCPEHNQGCDDGIPVLEQRFYMDALKSCGDIRCVKTIVRKMGKIISISKAIFLYDLAMNFEPDAELLQDLLDLCKKEKKQSCSTLTQLAKRFSMNANMELDENKGPILKTIKFYHHQLESALERRDKDAETYLMWLMKGLENLGTLVQDLHQECVSSVLKIAQNKKHSLSLRNTAIKALRAMNFDESVEAALRELLADTSESVSLRSQAFLNLDKYAKKKTVKYLIQILRQEQIQQLSTFMTTHILNVLESEEPTWEERQAVWKECIAAEKQPIVPLMGGGFGRGKSTYVEFSKYFVFPFTTYNMGAQIELSIIYDPSNLVPKSVSFRTKGRLGNTDYEILELTLEAEGMERFMQSLYKTQGKAFFQRLMGILKFFNAPSKQKDGDYTLFFEKKIVDELKELLQMVNFPESSMPTGYIHIKAMGGNVAMVDLQSLFQYLHIPNLQMLLAETLRRTDLKLVQASRFAELYRSLPSVFGAPFNLTLSSTRVNSLNISTSLGLGQLLPPKDIAMNAGIQSKFAVDFRARMELLLPGLRPHGLGLNIGVNMFGGGSGGMTLTSEDRSDQGVVQYWKSRIHIENIYEPVDLVKVKSRTFVLRAGELTRVSAEEDPSVKKYVFDGCTGPRIKALLGRKICIQLSYPNVYNSVDYPYMPLTGDVDLRFFVVPNDIALLTYNIDIEREIKTDKKTPGLIGTVKIRCSAPGSNYQRQLHIDVLQKDHNSYLLVEIKVPELNNLRHYIEFETHEEAHDYGLKFSTGLGFHGTDFISANLDVIKQTIIPGIKTDYQSLLDFRFQMMDILFNLTLENSLKETNRLTKAHMRYHCSPRWPVLFELHADPEHAKQHHDLTEMELKMACVTLPDPKNEVSLKRTGVIIYPGQHFLLEADMKGNKPKIETKGKLTWDHPLGQEVLWLTGQIIDKGTAKKVNYKYDLTFDHKGDRTIIKVDALMTGVPESYDVTYTAVYNKNQKRRKRSWSELSQHFKRVSEGIRRGIYVEKKPPMPKIPKAPKKTKKWVNPLANSPPGPHKDVFMNFYEMMKRGPKQWSAEGTAHITIRPIRDKHASHPIGTELVLKTSLDYPTWTKQENIKAAIVYARSIKVMEKGKTMIGHVSVESTKTQGGLLFEFDMSKHKDYLDYSHNLTLWSVTSGEITREFIVDLKVRGDHLFNMTQRLLTGPLNGSVEMNYNKHKKTGVEFFRMDSDIIDKSGVLKCKFHMKQTWQGFGTPEYMLKSAYALEHPAFQYESKVDLKRNPDKLFMDHKAKVKANVLFMVEIDEHLTVLQTRDLRLPDVKLKIDMPKNGVKIRGHVENEKEFQLKMDIQKPGQPAISGITWSIILETPYKIKNVLVWNPHLTKMSSQLLGKIREALLVQINYQMDIMITNIIKPFSDQIVAPTGKTVGELFDLIVMSNLRAVVPYLDNLPLSSRPVSHAVYERLYRLSLAYENVSKALGSSEFNTQYKHLRKGFTIILSTILKYVKSRINHPPRILSDYFTQIAMPKLMHSVQSNTIEFSLNHNFIWESFKVAPKMTHTSLFLMTYYYSPGHFFIREYVPVTAISYQNQMATFDGVVYNLPEDFANDKCIHLLAADLMDKKYAVLREGDAFTLICSKNRVKVSRDCKVYVDGSDKPSELPYECPMQMITAKMWGPYLVVNSIYGVEIICDTENLKVVLEGVHLNTTMGLLGTADGDQGTDMRLSDGSFAPNKADFINHFELSRKKVCQVAPEQRDPRNQRSSCFNDIRKKCMHAFASFGSPFMKCFMSVNPKYFMMQCLKNVRACKPDVMNLELCRVMHLYATHCLIKMPIQMPEHCMLCDEAQGKKWKVNTNKQKRDIVIIVDQNQKINGYRPLFYFMNLFENAQIEKAQMGLVACGGEGIFEHPNVYTMDGRHFGTENTLTKALKTLNEGMKPNKGCGGMKDCVAHKSHGHDDRHGHEGHIPRLHIDHSPHHVGHRITDLHQALEWASDYPFRPDSGRMIMLFADMSILRNLTDIGSVLATIVEKDIVVNIFTNTKELLGKKAVGITHTGRVLTTKKKKQMQEPPEIEYFSLLKNTNGTLWNIETILGRKPQQEKIMKIINEEFEKQMAMKRCRLCKCTSPKHELLGSVQCAASTCNK